MVNNTLEHIEEKSSFDDVAENLLKIIDTYDIRQKVKIISRISESILQQQTQQ